MYLEKMMVKNCLRNLLRVIYFIVLSLSLGVQAQEQADSSTPSELSIELINNQYGTHCMDATLAMYLNFSEPNSPHAVDSEKISILTGRTNPNLSTSSWGTYTNLADHGYLVNVYSSFDVEKFSKNNYEPVVGVENYWRDIGVNIEKLANDASKTLEAQYEKLISYLQMPKNESEFSLIKNLIDQKLPVITYVHDMSHALLIAGYRESKEGSGSLVKEILLLDPGLYDEGEKKWISFSEFKDSYWRKNIAPHLITLKKPE